MSKFLILWEVDSARVPTDAKERGTAWLALIEMVKADMKKGMTKDWGSFPGELRGYSIGEGTEHDIGRLCLPYMPWVKFEVHPVASLADNEQAIKGLAK